jgi:hypothetical protein
MIKSRKKKSLFYVETSYLREREKMQMDDIRSKIKPKLHIFVKRRSETYA